MVINPSHSVVPTHLVVPPELSPPAHAWVRPDHRLRLDPRVQRGDPLEYPVRLAPVGAAATRAPQPHLAAAAACSREPNPFLALRSALQGGMELNERQLILIVLSQENIYKMLAQLSAVGNRIILFTLDWLISIK